MKESILDYEGNLVEKKDIFRIIVSEKGSDESMKREAVVSDLEMTMKNNIFHQEHSVNY